MELPNRPESDEFVPRTAGNLILGLGSAVSLAAGVSVAAGERLPAAAIMFASGIVILGIGAATKYIRPQQ